MKKIQLVARQDIFRDEHHLHDDNGLRALNGICYGRVHEIEDETDPLSIWHALRLELKKDYPTFSADRYAIRFEDGHEIACSDKLAMRTKNQADENFRKLAALFPEAVTEAVNADGEVVRAIDKDVLTQLISTKVVDGQEERYRFTWPDKRKAILAANAPIAATLRPVRSQSVGKDGAEGGFDSENLYIEGDNLDVLKLLQETYLGKVKMIYIDPPYNTGSDFVYEDDFAEDAAEYLARSGQFDDQGNRLTQNTERNGRFHTDWLNMMYPRLKLAKNLLAEDGAIFISIDDHEQVNLKKICDEVFGENNFLAVFVWASKGSGAYDSSHYKTEHEYIIGYCKNPNYYVANQEEYDTSNDNAYNQIDDRFAIAGKYKRQALAMGTLSYSATLDYPIQTPDGSELYPGGRFGPPYAWRYSKSKMKKALSEGFAEFVKTRNGWSLFSKQYERMDDDGNIISRSKPYGTMSIKAINRNGSELLKELLGNRLFAYPKPIDIPLTLMKSATNRNEIILDFFSGSATTAHAVMQLNAEDGGHRKFILVQLPEATDEGSEGYKAGYRTICDIGRERIRRAAKKIREGSGLALPPGFDGGFRCLRLDSTTMQDVYYSPDAIAQTLLDAMADNIKPDRTPEDLLFQVMLSLGVELSSPIKATVIGGKRVFDVADGFLLACFDPGVTTDTVTAIAKRKPSYAVFRDSAMADDSTAANFDQIFETYSPQTTRKVL